jgi:hypothetical protein
MWLWRNTSTTLKKQTVQLQVCLLKKAQEGPLIRTRLGDEAVIDDPIQYIYAHTARRLRSGLGLGNARPIDMVAGKEAGAGFPWTLDELCSESERSNWPYPSRVSC